MEMNMEAAQPPPYETLAGASTNAKEDADSYDTLLVPRRIMTKILAIRPHAERMRLTKEYIVKKGLVIEDREEASTHQARALAEAIKHVRRDAQGAHNAFIAAVYNIAIMSEHFLRGFCGVFSKYYDSDSEAAALAALAELVAAGEDEARCAHQAEVGKIEAAFRDAAKQLDEEYMALLENMLAEMELHAVSRDDEVIRR